jgi:hypothetical protein
LVKEEVVDLEEAVEPELQDVQEPLVVPEPQAHPAQLVNLEVLDSVVKVDKEVKTLNKYEKKVIVANSLRAEFFYRKHRL